VQAWEDRPRECSRGREMYLQACEGGVQYCTLGAAVFQSKKGTFLHVRYFGLAVLTGVAGRVQFTAPFWST